MVYNIIEQIKEIEKDIIYSKLKEYEHISLKIALTGLKIKYQELIKEDTK